MPPEASRQPDLQAIVGALVLAADHALSIRDIRDILVAVEEERRIESDENLAATAADDGEKERATEGDTYGITEESVREAITLLGSTLAATGAGMELVEVAGGYRLRTAAELGPWVRRMLNRGKPQRISRPMIETLAIIAYRQPISRSEIESIRGVGVSHVIKALMEMQLVRIIGRSELPGRPFLFSTTGTFLDHFGLKSLNELNELQQGVERTPVKEQQARHKRPPADTAPPAETPRDNESTG